MLTEGQASRYPQVVDNRSCRSAGKCHHSYSSWEYPAPFSCHHVFLSHLCTFVYLQVRRANPVPELLYCIWMMRWDWEHHSSRPSLGALPWAWWLQSQVYGEIALSKVTSFGMRGLRPMEQTAPEKGRITSQGSSRVHKGRAPAGSFWPLFSVLLIQETNCPVDALWLSGFEKPARGTKLFIQPTVQMDAVSKSCSKSTAT